MWKTGRGKKTMQGNDAALTRARVVAALSVAAVVAACVLIFLMSAKPADESDALSLGIVGRIIGFIVPGYDQMSAADQLYWQGVLNHPVRKTAHFLEYLGLGLLTFNMLVQVSHARLLAKAGEGAEVGPAKPGAITAESSAVPTESGAASAQTAANPKTLALGAWALATAYAATDEVHQIFVAGRSGMFTDVLLDSAGVLAGVLLGLLIWHIARKRRTAR